MPILQLFTDARRTETLRQQRRERVREVLAQLNPQHARLLVLHSGGMRYKDLAEELGIAPDRIGTMLAQAVAEFERRYSARLLQAMSPSTRASGAPRDFTLADVDLTLEHPRVWTNGKLEEATANNSAFIAAHILYLYLPEGAFEISLMPETGLGFQKAGVVAAKTLAFHDGMSEYRIESSSQIVPGEGLYNIYVSRDPNSGPGPGKAGFALGGADKAKSLSVTKR